MKKIFFVLCVLWSAVTMAQAPNYVNYNERRHNLAFSTNALNIPAGATPAKTTGQYARSGALFYDTTGVDTGLYVSHGAYWVQIGGDGVNIYNSNGTTTGARSVNLGGNLTFLGHNSRIITFDSVGQFAVSRSGIDRLIISNAETHLRAGNAGSDIQLINGIIYYTAPQGHLIGSNGSYVNVGPQNIYQFTDSSLVLASESADQYADDSLIWRTTDRATQIKLFPDSMSLYQDDGEYYVYDLQTASDMTNKKVMLWDNVLSEWKVIDQSAITGVNFYNSDGTTNGVRTVNLGGSITWLAHNNRQINYDSVSQFNVRRSGVTRLGITSSLTTLNSADGATGALISNGVYSVTAGTQYIASTGISSFDIRDSVVLKPHRSWFRIDSLNHALSATAKMVTWDSVTGMMETRAIPGGGGGSGTVTSVDPGYGLIGTPDPITTTGTVILDTTIAMNKAGAQVISGAKNFTASPTLSSHTATYLLYAGTGGLVSSTGNMYYDGARAVFGTTAQIGQGASSGEAAGGATYASIGADWVELRPSWLTGSSSAGLRALYFNGSAWQSAIEYGFTSGGVATNMSLLKSGGKVGIGIAPASVTAKLHVVDNTVTTGNAALITSTSATSGAGLNISITGTAAAGDGSFAGSQAGMKISLSGTNATSSVITFGNYIDNAHAGTGANNYGVYSTTSNGSDGTAGYFQSLGTNANNTGVNGQATGTGSAVNVGGKFNAGGGATNYALLTTGANSGFLVAAPTSALHTTSFATAYAAKTTTYPIVAADHTLEATSGTFTMTLPTAVGIAGRQYVITNSGSGVVTLATTSSQTFVNVTATPITLTLNQFSTVTVVSNGANWLRTSSL